MTIEFLKTFQKQYFKGSKEINKRIIHTAKGLVDRIFKREEFLSELSVTESLRIQYGVELLKYAIANKEATIEQLKYYKAGLKTINAKLKHRIDFLVLTSGSLVVFGLTSSSGKSSVLLDTFPTLETSPMAHAPSYFVLGMLCLIGLTLFERASVLYLIARNEEIINVIDSVS
ncbi:MULTISPECIES: hypothetical protein [unclassified Pseudomonas]|uniref:hypothetical protein n=1 Tax=unclassified Pseudomonas TaxID=196821 RepID=UPI000A1F556E|nr:MULTISPECIES: hypothetical protein [unclassified Pseudomonas]